MSMVHAFPLAFAIHDENYGVPWQYGGKGKGTFDFKETFPFGGGGAQSHPGAPQAVSPIAQFAAQEALAEAGLQTGNSSGLFIPMKYLVGMLLALVVLCLLEAAVVVLFLMHKI